MKYYNQLSKILSYKQKKSFVILIFLMLISVSLEILTLNSLFLLLSFFSDPESITNNRIFAYLKGIDQSNFTYLNLLLVFLVIFLLKTIFSIIIIYKENTFINNSRAEISSDFFRGYIYMPRIFHLRTNISETTKNITTEIDVFIAALLSVSIITLELFVLVGLVMFLLLVNYKITLLSFLSLLLFSIFLSYLNTHKILTLGKERVKLTQIRLKNILEGLSGAKIFTLTGSREKLIDDFKATNNQLAKNNIINSFRNGIPRPLFELFILFLVVFFLALFLKSDTSFKNLIPTLGVFLTAAYRLAPSFGKILTNIQKFQYNIAAANKLYIDKEKFKIKYEKKITLDKVNFRKEININNMSFTYDKNLKNEKNYILRNVNFLIKPNQKVGIVGKSGSGKSTLLDILMGIADPQFGKILVDENNLNEIKDSWYKKIGCVPQEVFILDDSLKRNIAFGLPDNQIEEDKILRAIDLANLSKLKENLKYGIENLVGDKGSRLSGGQRQRIGVARALYNNPDILFLDEATSSLDVETEKKIIDEIFNKQINKTIIFVSHKKENLKYCDCIYEVKEKKLIKLN
jgi:ATP-binding cassette, subfamily B, bacterial PglK